MIANGRTCWDLRRNVKSKVNLPYLSFAIQLQQYPMSFINYISLGNTNMNIIRCKLYFFFLLHQQYPCPGCGKLSFAADSYFFCNGKASSHCVNKGYLDKLPTKWHGEKMQDMNVSDSHWEQLVWRLDFFFFYLYQPHWSAAAACLFKDG